MSVGPADTLSMPWSQGFHRYLLGVKIRHVRRCNNRAVAGFAPTHNANGYHTMKISTIVLIITTLLLAGFAFHTPTGSMSERAPVVTHMTGNEDAVWLSMSNNELIYCWWKEAPDRITERPRCRKLDRWSVELR